MDDRVCVICGAPGKPGKNACGECGGAVVYVGERAEPVGAVAVAVAGGGAASEWDAPPVGAPPLALKEHAAPGRRTSGWAYLMSTMLVLVVVVAAFGAWRVYGHSSAAVPKELRGYAHGDGDVYTDGAFTVRLPYGYQRSDFVLPVGTREVTMRGASATAGNSELIFATGAPGGLNTVAPTLDQARTLAGSISQAIKVGGGTASVHIIETPHGPGFDFALHPSDGPTVIGQVVAVGNRMVCFVVVSEKAAEGALHALVDSFETA